MANSRRGETGFCASDEEQKKHDLKITRVYSIQYAMRYRPKWQQFLKVPPLQMYNVHVQLTIFVHIKSSKKEL